jgi:hypothetical protein
MLSRINCFKIVKNHFLTLRRFGQTSKSIYWQDFILFLILPITTSLILAYYQIGFKSQITNLIAAISILGGFLFNLLAIIYNSMENLKRDASDNKIKKIYAKEIHSNISYNILLAISCVILLLIYNINIPVFKFQNLLQGIILFLNYYLLTSFFLTLLMVLNRIYILLDKNISATPPSS